jgi:acyl-ACP thioesterase
LRVDDIGAGYPRDDGSAFPERRSVLVVPVELVPFAGRGRRYVGARRVHLGDVDGTARLRLEALARFLQDVATDDADDAGLSSLGGVWVVRRVTMQIDALPCFHEQVELATFCSGTGPRWAERRTTVMTAARAMVEAAAIWVLIDGAGGRPVPLDDEFFSLYGESAAGRTVSSRLGHRRPPAGLAARPWPLRASDFDLLEHVNNARYLEAVEDELAARLPGRAVRRLDVEYRGAVERADEVQLTSELQETPAGAELSVWLLAGREVRMSAVVTAS